MITVLNGLLLLVIEENNIDHRNAVYIYYLSSTVLRVCWYALVAVGSSFNRRNIHTVQVRLVQQSAVKFHHPVLAATICPRQSPWSWVRVPASVTRLQACAILDSFISGP